jgi:hypothetical protein
MIGETTRDVVVLGYKGCLGSAFVGSVGGLCLGRKKGSPRRFAF